jgi:hypothetical protein
MKSSEVYRLVREVFNPWAKEAGFKRGRGGMLTYARPDSDRTTFETFWFQCSQEGWDPFAGSKFTLEFQKATDPGPGHGTDRARFNRLLSASEREHVRSLQNVVIRKLRRSPHDHWAYSAADDLRRWYLARSDEDRDPSRESDDLWLRYGDEADVQAWAQFLLPLVPKLLDEFFNHEAEWRLT